MTLQSATSMSLVVFFLVNAGDACRRAVCMNEANLNSQ